MSNKSDADSNIRIGKLVQVARESQHVSQADVARATHMSNNHISGIERGTSKMSVDLLLGYCKVLDMTPNEILGYDDSEIIPSLRSKIKSMEPNKQRKLEGLIRYIEDF